MPRGATCPSWRTSSLEWKGIRPGPRAIQEERAITIVASLRGNDHFLQFAVPVLLGGKPMLVQHEHQLQGVH